MPEARIAYSLMKALSLSEDDLSTLLRSEEALERAYGKALRAQARIDMAHQPKERLTHSEREHLARRNRIIALLRDRGAVPLLELRRLTGSSERSARRNLNKLEAEGLIRRSERQGAQGFKTIHWTGPKEEETV